MKRFIILFAMPLLSGSFIASAEKKTPEGVVVSLETSLCMEHTNQAKCGRDIAYIVGLTSTISHMSGLCEASGRDSEACKSAEKAYKFFQEDFDKVKK